MANSSGYAGGWSSLLSGQQGKATQTDFSSGQGMAARDFTDDVGNDLVPGFSMNGLVDNQNQGPLLAALSQVNAPMFQQVPPALSAQPGAVVQPQPAGLKSSFSDLLMKLSEGYNRGGLLGGIAAGTGNQGLANFSEGYTRGGFLGAVGAGTGNEQLANVSEAYNKGGVLGSFAQFLRK